MTEDPYSPALLPTGFVDLLPPEARTEAEGVAALVRVFASYGYNHVRPPLMEFEETLLSGSGLSLADQSFRVMDPETRRMMVVRPDITPQIARMAATRLQNLPRPLRLSYVGSCVLVQPSAADESGRQIMQAGIELIGPDSPQADAEVVCVAAEALEQLDIPGVSFDLTMPSLIPALLEEAAVPEAERPALMRALDRKDAAAVSALGGELSEILTALLQAAGPADRVLPLLAKISLPQRACAAMERLTKVVAAIKVQSPGLRLTIDPVEFRGWKYHTGVCVTVFARGCSEELGRGGRYLCNDDEPACGLTFRPDVLLRLVPAAPVMQRVYIAPGANAEVANGLRRRGFAAIISLCAATDTEEVFEADARRLGCSHILIDATCVELV